MLRAIAELDYINASFIDVSKTNKTIQNHQLLFPSTHAGVQPAWGIHCHTDASEEHSERLLEDDLGVPDKICCRTLQDGRGYGGGIQISYNIQLVPIHVHAGLAYYSMLHAET